MIEKMDEKITISQIMKKLDAFSKERNWKKYHNPKDVAISISIDASERVRARRESESGFGIKI